MTEKTLADRVRHIEFLVETLCVAQLGYALTFVESACLRDIADRRNREQRKHEIKNQIEQLETELKELS